MKKIILLVVLSLSIIAVANAAKVKPQAANVIDSQSIFGGYYIGFFGGYNWIHSNLAQTTTFNNTIIGAQIPKLLTLATGSSTANAKLHSDDGIFGIFAGYGTVVDNHYYLGSIINAAYQNTSELSAFGPRTFNSKMRVNASNTVVNTTTKLSGASSLKLQQTFGIAFKPGVLVTPKTLIFGLIGYEAGRFTLQSNSIVLTNNSINDAQMTNLNNTAAKGSTKEKYLSGLRLGIGIDQYVGHHLSIGAQYFYTHYFSDIHSGAGPIKSQTVIGPNNASTVTYVSRFGASASSVSTNEVEGFITYHFS